jgi:hypothetical protein
MIGRPLHYVGLSRHIEYPVSFHRHAVRVKYGVVANVIFSLSYLPLEDAASIFVICASDGR